MKKIRKRRSLPERRKYIRLDTVFPVQFQLVTGEANAALCEKLQGFTNNIGKGGICLKVNDLPLELCRIIREKKAGLSLNIEVPLRRGLIHALADVAWFSESVEKTGQFLIGLHYTKINPADNRRIMRYAWTKKLFLPVTIGLIIFLAFALALNTYINIKLIKGNKTLVEQLVKIIQESSVAKQKVKEFARQAQQLQLELEELQVRIEAAEEKRKNESEERIRQLNEAIARLNEEKISLQEKLLDLRHRENAITQELLRLDKKKSTLEKANLDKMYQWLKVHQNPRTGLLLSFEGDNDISRLAFIYDQALAALAYANFGDIERAEKILNFFREKAEQKEGLFFNAYYTDSGLPAEYTIHSGPNIWVGIAAVHLAQKSSAPQYLKLAKEIAARIINLRRGLAQKGIPGGLDINWYSTEHNLDAYAFFNMLYKVTGEKAYFNYAQEVLAWLVRHTYDAQDIPLKRGKGDSTIATDTYAWSIAAIGPARLEKLKMSPDRIIEFAEDNCRVEVNYLRPEGKSLKVKGFDFAAQRNVARGGVVSAEWTAQMVLAYKIMADFYYKKGLKAKAHGYEMKADEYMAELGKMIISSPSASGQGESCLPYASEEFIDTGHGWMTPKGRSTGSVAATAYTLFAYYNYNPLEINE